MLLLTFMPPPASPYVQTVSNLNWLSALPSYEGRAAVEGGQIVFLFLATIIYGRALSIVHEITEF
jgi:hypothetical protein